MASVSTMAVGNPAEQPVLHVGRQDAAARSEHQDRIEVVAAGLASSASDERSADRVADDRQHRDPLTLDRRRTVPASMRRCGVEHRPPSAQHGSPRRPVAAGVHERPEGIRDVDVGTATPWSARGGAAGGPGRPSIVRRRPRAGGTATPPVMVAKKMSSWRHITPLGDRSSRRCRRCTGRRRSGARSPPTRTLAARRSS